MKQLLAFLLGTLLFACNQKKSPDVPEEKTASAVSPSEIKEVEIGDTRYMDMAKKGFDYLAAGNVEGWLAGFAENAVYKWNNNDSLAGKAAIADYWKKRMAETIDKLEFKEEIYLVTKVNKLTQAVPATGTYVMNWNLVTGKYKTGKTMTQAIHTVMHFDENDKIDFLMQYLDRVPIIAAMK